jgi:chemosensory pili system protein ChpA (sensor histidine kinase/response regulator)
MSAHSSKGGLKWVRDELLANLDKIGVQVGEGADVGDTITLLFEMRAVLMALPFPAAAMLAEEMQRTCEQMTKEATLDAEQARQSVLLAGVQLGDYLRRKDSAARRDPLELLGNINDLRHSRGVPPISAAELLVPASVLRQGDQLPAESLDSLVRLALRVRPHFHRYLVRWFSGENAHEGLLGLSRLFSDMRRYFKQGPVHELFLAAEAVIGALLDGHLEADAPTKALIGRIDKVLKPLTASAPAWPADLATALIGDLLARIAHMPASSPAVQQLEDVLGHRLIESETIDSLPRSTENDTAPMLAGLRRELNDIAVSLEKLSDGALDRGELAAGPRRLARLAESLGALNQEAAALRISRCAEALDLELRASVPDEGRVGDVVRTLRQVDEELEAFADLTEFASDAAHGRRLPRADEATAETLVKARQVLSRARDVVAGGPLNTPGLDQLDDIHQSLQALSDDVRGVGEREPARLLETLAAQLRTRYLEPKQLPGEAGLELLARAMAAVDIYLEDRLERDVADVRMIAEADYAIERLASLLRSDDEIEGDSEASDSLPWSEVSQSVNLEFLNLFFDEAQEELESLRISYERWSQDRSDDVALSSFKRSFQTLKNSGSLVGARHLADLSRSVVSVLERLFDRELMPDLPVTDFLSDVVATMPDIIECESQGREAPTAQLMRAARALLTDRAGQGGKVIPLTVNRDARPAEPSGSEAAASTRPPPLQSEAAETAGGAVRRVRCRRRPGDERGF